MKTKHKIKIFLLSLLLTKKGIRLFLRNGFYLLLLIPGITRAQISFKMRVGYAVTTNEPIIAPAVEFAAHGLAMTPEMMIHWRDDEPVNFGLKISYQYQFIQVGYGRYFDLYTTDKFDQSRNGFSNLFFVAAYWKHYFIEADYIRQPIFSIGAKTTIFNIQ